ncbi:DUF2487 family protein [Salinicoccus sp. ID82-1]|uniref:DUF2487 family protein n=1 Tax=Salinicoccus cyprini TaxID=2493691 RepID=A0A558AZ49_9STAP|nr:MULTISPECIES: DUF2487 family protein [Salinicoccus]MCG1009098.1 DUF2487 family protein [Salinicoccus sp. ID82-1]TVT29543.1 DUF2487 family protein [Salinicoccus cyprini]
MLYNHQDLKVLKDEIEFVDTALIPFASADMNGSARDNASDMEMIQMVTIQLEKQFKGRLFITPAMMTVEGMTEVLETYIEQLEAYGFKKVIILTHLDKSFDSAHSIVVNRIPLEDMDAEMKMSLINDEVKNVMKQVITIWNHRN